MCFLGAQDWFTLISFDNPDLIYNLDCKFNRQLRMDYEYGPITDYKQVYPYYRNCHNKSSLDADNTFLVHLNGNVSNFGDYKIQFENNLKRLDSKVLKILPI